MPAPPRKPGTFSRRHYGLQRQDLYLYHKKSAGIGAAQKSSEFGVGFQRTESPQGRKNHQEAGDGHRQDQAKRLERGFGRSRFPNDCGNGPPDGFGDRGLRRF